MICCMKIHHSTWERPESYHASYLSLPEPHSEPGAFVSLGELDTQQGQRARVRSRGWKWAQPKPTTPTHTPEPTPSPCCASAPLQTPPWPWRVAGEGCTRVVASCWSPSCMWKACSRLQVLQAKKMALDKWAAFSRPAFKEMVCRPIRNVCHRR